MPTVQFPWYLTHLLRTAAGIAERQMNHALRATDITHCQAEILIELKNKRGVCMSEISEKLCCHKSNITQIVDGLIARKLIDRTPCKEDRRRSHLNLTTKGEVLLSKVHASLRRMTSPFDTLSSGDQTKLGSVLAQYVEEHREG